MPTASAVVADLIDTAVGRTAITFQTLELWSDEANRIEMAAPGNLTGRFYLRFSVEDIPNVLSQIAGVLGSTIFRLRPLSSTTMTSPTALYR